jgi:hypothetical protein
MHVHAVPESGTFKLNRFHVEKNNVRSHWFHGMKDTDNQPETGKQPFFWQFGFLCHLEKGNI